MEYLKVFTDFAKVVEPLGDAETGRLFRAMLEYAESGTEPNFSGNERFIWPTAKLQIDREADYLRKQRENGKSGGRPKTQQNPTEPNETQQNPTEPNESEKSHKDKDKDKDKDIITSSLRSEVRRVFTPPTPEEVKAYCLARGNSVDYRRFVDYYTANGWKVGRNKMVDWKSAVRTWERGDNASGGSGNIFKDIARDEGIL